MRHVREPGREVPVIAEADVVVAGGGPGGCVAAVAAARAGADVMLVERYGYPGGMATGGLMTSFNGFRNERPPDETQTVRGIAQEIVWELAKLGGATGRTAHGDFGEIRPGADLPYAVGFDPEVLKYVLLKMLGGAGVKMLFHSWASGALVRDGRIDAVVCESKSGRVAVAGDVFVDATGDGVVAASAGAPFEMASVAEAGSRTMPMTLMYRIAGYEPERSGELDPERAGRRRPRGIHINNCVVRWGPYTRGEGLSVEDLTRAEIETRTALFDTLAELRKEPGFESAFIVQTADYVGVRETRRFKGLYTVTEADAVEGRRFDDVVAVSSNPVPGYYGKRYFFDHEGFAVPYRALVPTGIDNLLLAGRIISAHEVPFQSARSMAPLMAVSQAAGAAAAICATDRVSPKDVDVKKL